jgi:putative chitinase
MTAEAAFDALRAYKRELTGEGLSDADVVTVNTLFAAWERHALAAVNPTALTDAAAFFASVRNSFGSLSTTQVEGFNRLLQAMAIASWPIAWVAYALATGWRETNKQMQPVEEGYYLGAKAAAFQKGLRYYPWFGRGDVQLTWKGDDRQPHYGYARADAELGLNGALLADPTLALRPDISAKVMVQGMAGGWFSGKKLADYLPTHGPADIHQFANARPIINGHDHDVEIAKDAINFQAALQAGGWR